MFRAARACVLWKACLPLAREKSRQLFGSGHSLSHRYGQRVSQGYEKRLMSLNIQHQS